MTKDAPENLRAKRTVARTKATKLLNDLNALWSQKDAADSDDLAYAINQAEGHVDFMQKLQLELDQHELPDDSNHVQGLEQIIFKAKRLLARLDNASLVKTNAQFGPQSSSNTGEIKKKDFQLPTFKGDVLLWPEFWDLFKVAIHDNQQYSPAEKMVHLKRHLEGEAARAIQGLTTTSDHYSAAVKILKDRFGPHGLPRVFRARVVSTGGIYTASCWNLSLQWGFYVNFRLQKGYHQLA
ncbi:hypothetical protein E2C01_018336 [Portunus trituberculatus]|uniref:Uncharacterized protein n=1 Tax=Portunus trituberculatus TaxID=210409 RepID=A0A5B7DU84_PORTR|nr:hypothetical protein [Portunus trituberculatus]